MDYTVLIFENNQEIKQGIPEGLFGLGYHIKLSNSVETAEEEIKKQVPDLILIDLRTITDKELNLLLKNEQLTRLPRLVIVDKQDKESTVELRNENYIVSPFDISDLAKQINLLIHHLDSQADHEDRVSEAVIIGDLVVDVEKTMIKRAGANIDLTTTEFNILKLFIQNPNRVLTKENIYRSIWQENYHEGENSISVHICHLKKKIEVVPSKPQYIKTVWGKGYRLELS